MDANWSKVKICSPPPCQTPACASRRFSVSGSRRESLPVHLAQRANEGVSAFGADFAVAMAIVECCLAHAVLPRVRVDSILPARPNRNQCVRDECTLHYIAKVERGWAKGAYLPGPSRAIVRCNCTATDQPRRFFLAFFPSAAFAGDAFAGCGFPA